MRCWELRVGCFSALGRVTKGAEGLWQEVSEQECKLWDTKGKVRTVLRTDTVLLRDTVMAEEVEMGEEGSKTAWGR